MSRQEKKELYMLQVRLFRLAQFRWNLSSVACSMLFNQYNIYKYIETCYEFFHVQGDETDLEDIRLYLLNKGVSI